MTNQGVAIIRLGCVGCGANLDISQKMERLACGHCGTQQIVERTGGAVHLQGVAETLSRVQIGTDKTAAELAIARLTNERQQLLETRRQKELQRNELRSRKFVSWTQRIESNVKTVRILAIVGAFVGIFPASLIIAIVNRTFGVSGGLNFWIVIIWMAGFGFATRHILLKNARFNTDNLYLAREQDLEMFDIQTRSDLATFDAYISELNIKIQKNHQIANA